ncbi:MAG: hypothetical protein V1724_05620 [Chloroflexota bacterium]
MATDYLFTALIEWETGGSVHDPLQLLPVEFGPFKFDQSPNYEVYLVEQGFIDPPLSDELKPDYNYPVSAFHIEIEPELNSPMDRHAEEWCDEKLEQLEALLRLFQPGAIHIRRYGLLSTMDNGKLRRVVPLWTFLSSPEKPEPAPLYDRGSYRLDDSTLARFIDFFNSYWEIVQTKPTRIHTALYRFSQSYERRNLADRLTELVIALEALFGDEDGDSLTYKIALRGACWNYPSPSEARKKTFERIRKFYSARSQLLHGRELEPKFSNKEVQDLEEFVRQALIRFLKEHERGNVVKSGKQLDDLLFSVSHHQGLLCEVSRT